MLHWPARAFYLRPLLRHESNTQRFTRYNERPIEYRFVFQCITQLCPRSILDVGTGTVALPAMMRTCGALVTASDNVTDYWPSGMFNRHWLVIDDDVTKSRLPGNYEMITCVSVLEHIKDHRAAMREMFRLLASGGHLVLTCPYTDGEYVENVYVMPGVPERHRNKPYICRSYSREQLEQWTSDSGAAIVAQEFWRIQTGRVHRLGEWVFPPVQVARDDLHQLTCLLLRKTET